MSNCSTRVKFVQVGKGRIELLLMLAEMSPKVIVLHEWLDWGEKVTTHNKTKCPQEFERSQSDTTKMDRSKTRGSKQNERERENGKKKRENGKTEKKRGGENPKKNTKRNTKNPGHKIMIPEI